MANTYLTRTPSSAGNRRTFTISTWVKRSSIESGSKTIFGIGNSSSSTSDADWFSLAFNGSTNRIRSVQYNTVIFDSNRVFRDVSAWYHIVLAVDTTQGTASNRLKLYINGVQETSFSTVNYPSQNYDFVVNTTVPHMIGREDGNAGEYFSGYLSEYCFIDGSQLAADQFGEFDEDSGIWKPIDVSGLTFGTNGFYLDFEDSANLGNDANGGTDFTESGLAAIDQTTDTCTNNFATLNPLANVIAPVTLTEGNLKIAMTNSKGGNLSTISCTDGKYYAEMKITTAPQDFRFHWGIMPYPVVEADDPISAANAGIMLSGYNAAIYAGGGSINAFYGGVGRFSGNPILGLAIDLESATNTIAVSVNGAWITGDNTTDASFSNALKVDITSYVAAYDDWFIGCGSGNSSGTTGVYNINFGNGTFGTSAVTSAGTAGSTPGTFEYDVPSGYEPLSTKGLNA